MRRLLVAALVLLAALAVYTYAWGHPPAARATDDQGWRESRTSDGYGLATIHRYSYDTPGQAFGGALVATAGDWPGFPESTLVPTVLQKVADKEGFSLQKRGTQSLTLKELGGTTVQGTVYDVQKSGTPGTARAVVADLPCPRGPGYVIAVGHGTLGSNLVPATYDKAKRVVASVTCG